MHRSRRVRDSGIREIFACRIRNTAQGIWNLTNDWNPTSESGIQIPLTKTRNKYLESRIHSVESKTALHGATKSSQKEWLGTP